MLHDLIDESVLFDKFLVQHFFADLVNCSELDVVEAHFAVQDCKHDTSVLQSCQLRRRLLFFVRAGVGIFVI